MSYDEAKIRAVASTLKCYTEKPLRLVCDPFACCLRVLALLVDNVVEALIDGVLLLAALITPNNPEVELMLSYKQKVSIYGPADWSLYRWISSPWVQKIRGRHVIATMAEVHESLATNPVISVYECGLLYKLDITRKIGPLSLALTFCRIRRRGAVNTSIFFTQQRIEPTNTYGADCAISGAIACGFASGLIGTISPLSTSLETNRDWFSIGGCLQQKNSARSLRRSLSRAIKPHQVDGFEIRDPARLSVAGILNAPELSW